MSKYVFTPIFIASNFKGRDESSLRQHRTKIKIRGMEGGTDLILGIVSRYVKKTCGRNLVHHQIPKETNSRN